MRCRSAHSSHRLRVIPRWEVTMLAGGRARALQDSSKARRSLSSERRAGSGSRTNRRKERSRKCNRQAIWVVIVSRSLEREMIATQVEQVVMVHSWIETIIIGEIREHQEIHLDQDRDPEGCKMLSIEAVEVDQEVDSFQQPITQTQRSLKNQMEEQIDSVLSMMTLVSDKTKRDKQRWSLTESRKKCNSFRQVKTLMKFLSKLYTESLLTPSWQSSRRLEASTLLMFSKKWTW